MPLPIASQVHELFKRMVVSGRGDYDHTGLITAIEELAGIEEPEQEAVGASGS